MLELHYCAAPNPAKIAIMLEELALPYDLKFYSAVGGEHLTKDYFRLNPNRKLPALVDDVPAAGGTPLVVFESGAILIYLAEKSGRFLTASGADRYAVLQWLMFQMSGLGPMHGQAVHFRRYAAPAVDADHSYAIDRYSKEVLRLLGVMDYQLSDRDYLAGDYSIADIACYPWIEISKLLLRTETDRFPALTRWSERIGARPAVQRAMSIKDPRIDLSKVEAKLSPQEWSNLFGERQHDLASMQTNA